MAVAYVDKYIYVRISMAKEPNMPRHERGTCNAKTRQNTSCQAPPVWNKATDMPANGRCKLHGGLSFLVVCLCSVIWLGCHHLIF